MTFWGLNNYSDCYELFLYFERRCIIAKSSSKITNVPWSITVISFQGFVIIFILPSSISVSSRFHFFARLQKTKSTRDRLWYPQNFLSEQNLPPSFDVLTLCCKHKTKYFLKRLPKHFLQCKKMLNEPCNKLANITIEIISNQSYQLFILFPLGVTII